MRRRRLGAVAMAGVLGGAVAAGGCSFHYDVGDSSASQLCDVIVAEADDVEGAPFSMVRLVDEIAANPHRQPSAATAIAISYGVKGDAYDELGPYRPAVEFVARAGAPRPDGRAGVASPTRRVLESARAADEVIRAGDCAR